jgi:hypothetical protein
MHFLARMIISDHVVQTTRVICLGYRKLYVFCCCTVTRRLCLKCILYEKVAELSGLNAISHCHFRAKNASASALFNLFLYILKLINKIKSKSDTVQLQWPK